MISAWASPFKGGGGIFWEEGVDYGVPHIVAKKGVYSGGIGRFWEARISRGRVYILRGRGSFWEGGIDSRSIAYIVVEKGGIFGKMGYILGAPLDIKPGLYSGREGWIMGVSHILI